jgi:hypothetical protein
MLRWPSCQVSVCFRRFCTQRLNQALGDQRLELGDGRPRIAFARRLAPVPPRGPVPEAVCGRFTVSV